MTPVPSLLPLQLNNTFSCVTFHCQKYGLRSFLGFYIPQLIALEPKHMDQNVWLQVGHYDLGNDQTWQKCFGQLLTFKIIARKWEHSKKGSCLVVDTPFHIFPTTDGSIFRKYFNLIGCYNISTSMTWLLFIAFVGMISLFTKNKVKLYGLYLFKI